MKSQHGFSLIELGIVFIVLAAVGGAATAIVHTYNHALERAQTAEADAKVKGEALTGQLVANMRLQVEREQLDKQMADRAATDQRLQALERKVDAKIRQIYAQSPEAAKWAATAIPDDVRRVVRSRAAGGDDNRQDDPRAGPGRVDKPDAGAGVPRPAQYQRRPADVRPGAGVKPQ